MSDTRWSGTTVRRTAPRSAADGAWDGEEVTRRLVELTRRRDELTPRFARLAERLNEARERLASGLPPDQQLDSELSATRDVFGRLYAEARALAEGLAVPIEPPSNAPALPDISAVLAALEEGLRAERARQRQAAAARRATALAILDRVAQITYRGPSDADGFGPLRACQRSALALREEIAYGEPLPLHTDVAALNDGTHRFNHLLGLLDGLPTLDEPDYRRLVNTVSADFEESLARAAGRGLLVVKASRE